MAQAVFHEVVSADKDKLFQAIVRYEDYPKFVEGCSRVKVERPAAGKARVSYDVSMIKDISYTLDHVEDAAKGMMEWKLVSSDFIKLNTGRWELKSVGPGRTDLFYQIDIEFKIPVPGMILSRLVKSSLPSMVKSFATQAQKG